MITKPKQAVTQSSEPAHRLCYRPTMRLILAASLALLSITAPAQNPVSPETRTAVRNLIGEVLLNGQAYEYDRQLSDTIGPRLTGSDNYVRAVAWAQQQFTSLGADLGYGEAGEIAVEGFRNRIRPATTPPPR
jgi:hypothetical protein